MNRIELLVVPLGEPHDERALLDDLSAAERSRHASLRLAEDRRRYVLGHGLLRRWLARQTGVPARSVPLDVTCARCGGPHGRPRIEGSPDAQYRTSISHSGEHVVIAIGERGPIGVDIEPLDAADWQGFDDVALTASERAAVAARSRFGDRARLWTRKEAVLKALGRGLAGPLHGLDFAESLDRAGGTVAVTACGDRTVQWREVTGVPGYAVTLAAAHGGELRVSMPKEEAFARAC